MMVMAHIFVNMDMFTIIKNNVLDNEVEKKQYNTAKEIMEDILKK